MQDIWFRSFRPWSILIVMIHCGSIQINERANFYSEKKVCLIEKYNFTNVHRGAEF